jgi:late competence protein required for DNA uptake (superfamily II DNA/RNA helicase)
MSPQSSSDYDLIQRDLQAHAKTISALVEEIATLKTKIAVMESENEHRDERVKSIFNLGRTVLVTVITLALGVWFTFLSQGGFTNVK